MENIHPRKKELVLEELYLWIPKNVDQDLVAAVKEKVKLVERKEVVYSDSESDIQVGDWEESDDSDDDEVDPL